MCVRACCGPPVQVLIGARPAVFPPSLVLPSALWACVELGARAARPSCGTEPYSGHLPILPGASLLAVFFFSELS